MSTVKINTLANLLNRTWTTLANFLFVPIYLKYLGEEAYGLVTFFTTLQVVLNLLGLGLSKTLRREFSLFEKDDSVIVYKYKIFRSVEFIFFIIAGLIVSICYFGASFLSLKWLKISEIDLVTVTNTIRLMGISIAAQLVSNLYLGCLFGQELQVQANSLQFAWALLKNVGAVLIIIFWRNDILAFYVWHSTIDVIYLLTSRWLVIVSVKHKYARRIIWRFKDLRNLANIYRFALGILLISVGYAFNSQMDKVIVSKYFTLTELGAYNTVYSLSIVTTIITSAIGIAVFPIFTKLFTSSSIEKLQKTFGRYNDISVITTSVLGAFISVFATDILMTWTSNETITSIVAPIAGLIILGTVFSAVQEIPYNYFLSRKNTKVNNIQTVFQVVYVVLIMPLLVKYYGMKGAAFSWFFEMLISTLLYLYFFYRIYFTKNALLKTLKTFLPLIMSYIIAYLMKYLLNLVSFEYIQRVLLAILGGLITLIGYLYIRFRGIKNIFEV